MEFGCELLIPVSYLGESGGDMLAYSSDCINDPICFKRLSLTRKCIVNPLQRPRVEPKIIWSREWTPITNLEYGIEAAQKMACPRHTKYTVFEKNLSIDFPN